MTKAGDEVGKGKTEEGEQEGVIMVIHTCHWQTVSHGSQG